MNEIILFAEIVIVFSMVLAAQRIFGRDGLLMWPCMATILANITVVKSVTLFGMETMLGNVLFASTFLATDILTERWGVAEARRSVFLSLFGALLFIVASQVSLWYLPGELDVADGAMRHLFEMDIRVALASVSMLLLANLADVALYGKMREMTGGRAMWLRNNVSTILCNCLENVFFMLLGFYGMYDVRQCLEMALSVSVVEAVIGICDTPFLYLAVADGDRRRYHGPSVALSPDKG
ncbi:MAG: queuosine precursor transporter [Synergistaceae bacterium]|nr:queuosine precursor transporter [Synergistaceae bacterium]